jgi:predicted nucleotidyltransferase
MPTPLESMRIVARRLEPLNIPFAFLGGAAVCLLVDHPELTEFRPTKDVDVIVEVATYGEYSTLERRLRASGFQHDTSEGAPICRWIVEGCRADIMPIDSRALGMNSRWFSEALRLAKTANLGEGRTTQVVAPAMFLATKLDAFKDRGRGDCYASHDLEDVITLVDGRASVVEEVASASGQVRTFVAAAFAELLQHSDFLDAFPGHLSGMSGARQRAPLVMERFRAIAALK